MCVCVCVVGVGGRLSGHKSTIFGYDCFVTDYGSLLRTYCFLHHPKIHYIPFQPFVYNRGCATPYPALRIIIYHLNKGFGMFCPWMRNVSPLPTTLPLLLKLGRMYFGAFILEYFKSIHFRMGENAFQNPRFGMLKYCS